MKIFHYIDFFGNARACLVNEKDIDSVLSHADETIGGFIIEDKTEASE